MAISTEKFENIKSKIQQLIDEEMIAAENSFDLSHKFADPIPLGYLNAQGRSFISVEVLIILTSSASSLAAITIKFGNVDK